MPEHTSLQIARASGIYRCTGLGQTKYRKPGQPLPKHRCDGSATDCVWELRKEDNMFPDDAIPVFIGSSGIFHAIETDELPEVGSRYNIRETASCGLETGEHRVTSVDPDFQWAGKSYIKIEVERIGDLSEELPIHMAALMNV